MCLHDYYLACEISTVLKDPRLNSSSFVVELYMYRIVFLYLKHLELGGMSYCIGGYVCLCVYTCVSERHCVLDGYKCGISNLI